VWGVLPEGSAVRWDPKSSSWLPAPGTDLPAFQHVTVGGQQDVWAILQEQASPDGAAPPLFLFLFLFLFPYLFAFFRRVRDELEW